MLGVNYESSVYRELTQFGSVQPNTEKMNNLRIGTGCQILVWSYFCVNLIFLYSFLTHSFIKTEALEKLPSAYFLLHHLIFSFITTKYSDTTLETDLLKKSKLPPSPLISGYSVENTKPEHLTSSNPNLFLKKASA